MFQVYISFKKSRGKPSPAIAWSQKVLQEDKAEVGGKGHVGVQVR